MHALDLNSGLTSSSHGSDIAGNEKNRGKKREKGKTGRKTRFKSSEFVTPIVEPQLIDGEIEKSSENSIDCDNI